MARRHAHYKPEQRDALGDALSAVVSPPPWMRHGVCRNDPNPDLWFPNPCETGDEAVALCARCPVAQQCREYALEHAIPHGVWGGVTARQRLIEIKKRRRERGRERGYPAQLVDAVRRMAAAGMSDPEIAEQVDLCRDTVGRVRRRHNIPPGLSVGRVSVA